ncbi:hypothetical protein BFP72_09040 [Reichenbachiella sp. 5M10]|uniref:OmpA family protein n=1 Tax=Reichenbachiella sp. 5M10 TaxID=1889772 RepID=UPI000C153952|nr:OmpA family protein [Reichenbachiella sp. 5M10]PIB35525.1 hypothetical protein BFP72_09040 [Reichenbachiella sp. 5M10]
MTIQLFKFLLIVCIVWVPFASHAQNYAEIKYLGKSSEDKGDTEWDNESYVAAIKYYKYALQEDSSNLDVQLKIARSYRKINDNIEAEPHFRTYISHLDLASASAALDSAKLNIPDSIKADILYAFIEVLASNKKYDEASLWFEKYRTLKHSNPEQFARLSAYAEHTGFYKDQKYYTVSHLTQNNNRSDFGPAYYRDGFLFISNLHEKVIVRSKTKETKEDYFEIFYTQKRPDGGFEKAVIFSKKSRIKFHEGPLCAYQNGSKLAITRNTLDNKGKILRNAEGGNTLSIYLADIIDDKIKNVKPFPYNSPDYNTAYPAVSEDGSFMIFSSDMPGGFGKADLYITHWDGEAWTEPKNLGPKINTTERDVYPSLNGNVLYFASNGRPGLGGLDVYKTILSGSEPGAIKNVGAPVNSNKDDFGMITRTGKEGYFVSNRRNELHDVIYNYTYTKKNDDKLIAYVYAVDTTQYEPSVDSMAVDSSRYKVLHNASINVVDTRDNNYLAPIEVRNDTFVYVLDTGVEYSVLAAKQQYFTNKVSFQSGSEMNGELDWPVPLDSMEVGKSMVLKDILYDFDKATLRDSSKFQLNYLIVMLQDNPTMKAELHSHTDTRGNESYNMRLSKRRAQSVVDYMVNAGIREDRLVPVGMGESDPIIDCQDECSEDDHQLNRRTELIVTDL